MKRFVSGWDLLMLLGAIAVAVHNWLNGATPEQAAIHGLTPLALGLAALRVFTADNTNRKDGSK